MDFPITLNPKRWYRRVKSWPVVARLGLLLGLVAHVAAFIVMAVHQHPLGDTQEKLPFIVYHSQDKQGMMIEEQSALFDTEPLFLHTRWNYRAPLERDTLQPEQSVYFGPYRSITRVDQLKTLELADTVNAPEHGKIINEILVPGRTEVWQSFATLVTESHSEALGLIYVTLESLENPEEIRQTRFEESVIGEMASSLWSPIELQLFIHPGGVKSAPFVLRSSGDQNLDRALLNYLNVLLDRWSLESGAYRVMIGR